MSLIYKIMRYVNTFESFREKNKILIVVDVQKSFRKYFSVDYIDKLKKYCNTFDRVYQIFDNHFEGKSVDKGYIYDENPDVSIDDTYLLPNQIDIIEKRYNYDVDVDFYKRILSEETYRKISMMEEDGRLKKGDYFETKEETIIVYIGNNHKWFHVPIKLFNILKSLKDKIIYIVGGSEKECLEDIFITCKSMGIDVIKNNDYIYSSKHCP